METRSTAPNTLRIFLAFIVLVTVAALQLFLQQLAIGSPGEAEVGGFLWIYLGNLIASSPWLLLAFGILRLTERIPPTSKGRFGVHGAASVAIALFFLAWLALFHTLVADAPRGELWASYRFWFRQDVGEFFTVAVLIYWFVVAAGLAMGSRAHFVAEQQRRRALEAEIETRQTASRDAAGAESPYGSSGSEPLVIRSVGRSRLVDPDTIEWIEADAGYARLHTEDGSFLLRRSLADLAEDLAAQGFVRIHRSTIARLDRIVEIRPVSHGEAFVVLRGGQKLKVSRTYRESLSRLGL